MPRRLPSPAMSPARRLILALAAGAAALLLAACAGEPSRAATPSGAAGVQARAAADAEPTFVTATLTGSAITLTATSAPAGPVLFQALNSGSTPHRFVVVRTNLEAGALPIKGDRVDLAALEVIGAIDSVAPTNTESIRLELTAGRYVLLCDLPGHYAAGMRAAFTVR